MRKRSKAKHVMKKDNSKRKPGPEVTVSHQTLTNGDKILSD